MHIRQSLPNQLGLNMSHTLRFHPFSARIGIVESLCAEQGASDELEVVPRFDSQCYQYYGEITVPSF